MKALNSLLAETAAEVCEGFKDWFAGVIRKSKRHRQQIRQFQQDLARFGLGAQLVAIWSYRTLAFTPQSRIARQPQRGSPQFLSEQLAYQSWVGHYETPGVDN